MRTLWRMVAGGVLLLSWMSRPAEAQLVCSPPAVLPAPLQGAVTYSSPYGPRYATSGGLLEYQFHGGVDYSTGGKVGVPVYAVQGSIISDIHFQGPTSGGWIITILGGPADPCPKANFQYLHLFDNSSWTGSILLQGCTSGPQTCPTTDSEGQPIYAMTSNTVTGQVITLEGTVLGETSSTGQQCYIEVFWTNFATGNPASALSNCPGLPVGNPSFGMTTTNNVSNIIAQGEPIAVVGDSGAAQAGGAHLHLQVPGGGQNPLAYVQHDSNPMPNYSVSYSLDQGDTPTDLDNNVVELSGTAPSLLNPVNPAPYVNLLAPLVIRADVEYWSTDDLDQLNILVVQNDANAPSSCGAGAGVVLFNCFNYGGTGQGRTVSTAHPELLNQAVLQGIYPHPHSTDFPTINGGGEVSFLSMQDPLNFTTLNPGSYLILISAVDILGDTLQVPPIHMTIPPKLTVSVMGTGNVTSNPQGLNSGILCGVFSLPGATQVCSDWFNTGTAVTLTATPATGYSFTGWSGSCGGAAPTCMLTVSDDQLSTGYQVTATFTPTGIPIKVTLSPAGPPADGAVSIEPAGVKCVAGSGASTPSQICQPLSIGGVTCQENCTVFYSDSSIGSSVTLAAGAQTSGYFFNGWTGDCSSTFLQNCNVTIQPVADKPKGYSVTATFAPGVCVPSIWYLGTVVDNDGFTVPAVGDSDQSFGQYPRPDPGKDCATVSPIEAAQIPAAAYGVFCAEPEGAGLSGTIPGCVLTSYGSEAALEAELMLLEMLCDCF
jgi:uncharacterized repeat protein (TIGR02543 family)